MQTAKIACVIIAVIQFYFMLIAYVLIENTWKLGEDMTMDELGQIWKEIVK